MHTLPTSSPDDRAHQRLVTYAITAAPAAVGCALGILLGGRIPAQRRAAAAIVLLSVGALSAVPLTVEYITRRVAGPESARGHRQRLRSIRDAGLPADDDIYATPADFTEVDKPVSTVVTF